MGERNLSRQVASDVVDALKKSGHILVVKGGSEALAREVSALIDEHLPSITRGLAPRAVVGEVTSTFGSEAVDEAVEAMVQAIGGALMDSDHVEDVFAEDNVIRRDVFRVVRDALLASAGDDHADEEALGPISVRLETLGYVASTVAKLADTETLHDALERAALASEGLLTGFDPKVPEATFSLTADDEDARLDLEEAVADELENLVEMGLIDLPKVERRVTLSRDIQPEERAELRARIAEAAAKTLAGCAGSWGLEGTRTLRLSFTPLSEQDVRAADERAAAFGQEVNALLAATPPRAEAPAKEDVPTPSARAKARPEPEEAPEADEEPAESEETAEPEEAAEPPLSKRKSAAAPKARKSSKTTAKAVATKEPAAPKKTAVAKAPAAAKKTSVAKAPAAPKKTAKKAPARKAAVKKTAG